MLICGYSSFLLIWSIFISWPSFLVLFPGVLLSGSDMFFWCFGVLDILSYFSFGSILLHSPLFWHSPSPPAADTCLSAAVASFSSIRRGRENHHREKQKSSLIFSGFWSSVRMAVVSLVVSHSERNRYNTAILYDGELIEKAMCKLWSWLKRASGCIDSPSTASNLISVCAVLLLGSIRFFSQILLLDSSIRFLYQVLLFRSSDASMKKFYHVLLGSPCSLLLVLRLLSLHLDFSVCFSGSIPWLPHLISPNWAVDLEIRNAFSLSQQPRSLGAVERRTWTDSWTDFSNTRSVCDLIATFVAICSIRLFNRFALSVCSFGLLFRFAHLVCSFVHLVCSFGSFGLLTAALY